MGQMLVVTLREGIEAFLIVAIAAAYLRKTGRAGAWLGVFLFVVLMVTREGMEMAFITASLIRQVETMALVPGAIAGVLLAALLAAAWVRWGHRVNLGLFFQVTSIFLALFTLQLVFYAFHEFTEAKAVPGIDNAYWHIATEEWAEGSYAQISTACCWSCCRSRGWAGAGCA